MLARFLLLLFVLGCSFPAQAREIAGVAIADEVSQANGTKLVLNGAGIRSKFVFKIYIGALYLETKSSEPGVVIQQDGGKRIAMHFLYSEVDKDALVEAWNEGFKGNGTEGQLTDLAGQISSFNSLFDTVKEGDEIVLDYVPESGTTVSIRGQQKGVIAGKPFNDLLLSIWLGKSPVSNDLRDAMLGR